MILSQILWTACVTPFKDNGKQIDYKSFENLLRLQEKAGNGILLLGSTGEGLSISDKERKEIVEFACKLNLNTTIIVGVPSYNLNIALEWINFCNNFPINGYLMTTPIYTKPGVQGQTEWFKALLDAAKYQCMLYNIPSRSGVKLYPEVVKNLQDHDKFVALKDSSGMVDSIVEYKLATPKIEVFCGDDYMMPAMASEGAIGLVSVISNTLPVATRKYVEHCIKGWRIESKIWWQACKALFSASNPIPLKALMKDVGLIDYDFVRLPLSIKDLPSRKNSIEYYNIIKDWKGEEV